MADSKARSKSQPIAMMPAINKAPLAVLIFMAGTRTGVPS